VVVIGLALVALFAVSLYEQKHNARRQNAELAGIFSTLRRILAAVDLGVSASMQRSAERPAADAASQAREGDGPSAEVPTQVMSRVEFAAMTADLEAKAAPAPVAPKLEPDPPAEPSRKPPPPSLAPLTPTRVSPEGFSPAAPALPSSSRRPGAR